MFTYGFVVTGVALGLVTGASQKLELATNGQTPYVIVKLPSATPAEELSVKELSNHLSKVTGADFQIVVEGDATSVPTPGIYVGWTDYAHRQRIDASTLGDEEWVIKTVGENLVLTGGRPRGTLYAVYEFLEQHIGCHWFDKDTATIPSRPTLILPPLDVRDRPAFSDRHIYTGVADFAWLKTLRARNKDTRSTTAQFGFGNGLGSHTFYQYSREFPADHPEYMAMNNAGDRPAAPTGSGPGQICLTHPGARKLMLDRLKRLIAADHQAVEKAAGEGRKPQRVYFVEQNDSHWACQCPTCKALSDREGSDSGPLLDLINFLADGIRDEYPGILVETFAYTNTITPPKTIRPRDNVMIRLAQLNAEWSTDAVGRSWSREEYPDLFRPMTHPVNRHARETLESWGSIAKHLAYWDYWVQYSPRDKFPTPYTNTHCLQPDLKLFRDCNVEWFFTECEQSRQSSFFGLKCWLGWKLMQNPDQDRDALIDIYMKGVYGPASGVMTQYLHHLERSISAVPTDAGKMSRITPTQRPYLTLTFYRKCQDILDQAEALSEGKPEILSKVQEERIPVDAGMYCMWDALKEQLPTGESMPCKQEDLLNRYEAYRAAQLGKKTDALEKELQKLRDLANVHRKAKKPPVVRVPDLSSANPAGDPAAVNWDRAARLDSWYSVYGGDTPNRQVTGAMAHDKAHLYVMLEETGVDPTRLSKKWWSGDGWELFFTASKDGLPYRQFAVNPEAEHVAYDYEGGQKAWDSHAVVKQDNGKQRWRTLIALPLAELAGDGIKSGQKFYMNIFRTTRGGQTLCLSPIFENGFHDMKRLATVTLK